MKKFIGLFALVASFTFLAATATTAQNFVRNNTNCTFQVKIAYGDVATCTNNGTITAVVPPFTMFPLLGIPPGQGILATKGRYIGTSCAYYLSSTTCPYPYGPVDNVSCTSGCGDYTASLLSPAVLGGGTVIYLTN